MSKLALTIIFLILFSNIHYAQDCSQYIKVDKFTDKVSSYITIGSITFSFSADKGEKLSLMKVSENKSNIDDIGSGEARLYFLFDNNEKVVIKGQSFEGSSQASFNFSGENEKALQKLKTYKLQAIRFERPYGKADVDVPSGEQDFFINVFKCFERN